MTELKKNIVGQPAAFRGALRAHRADGWAELERAAELVRRGAEVAIVAIGASANAGASVAHAFNRHGRPARVIDASEFGPVALPPNTTVILLSRSGRSIELLHAAERCSREKFATIALTNDPASPLARAASVPVTLRVPFDHAVSIATYTAIVLLGGLLATHSRQPAETPSLAEEIEAACDRADVLMPEWEQQLAATRGDFSRRFTVFLARAESWASAQAGMLLWQEVAKLPALALTTGAFRHGPQEMLRQPINVALWLAAGASLDHDRQLACDLARAGANVAVLAPQPVDVPGAQTWLVPDLRPEFAAAFNVIPFQLMAESVATTLGIDPDRFLFCSYIVEREGGL